MNFNEFLFGFLTFNLMTLAQNMCKIFSLFPSKQLVNRENRDKLSVYFSIFWMIKCTIIQKQTFGTWKFDKIGVLVNFIIEKLKIIHLLCLSFLWWQVFLREREKIFYTYSGPRWYFHNSTNRSDLQYIKGNTL